MLRGGGRSVPLHLTVELKVHEIFRGLYDSTRGRLGICTPSLLRCTTSAYPGRSTSRSGRRSLDRRTRRRHRVETEEGTRPGLDRGDGRREELLEVGVDQPAAGGLLESDHSNRGRRTRSGSSTPTLNSRGPESEGGRRGGRSDACARGYARAALEGQRALRAEGTRSWAAAAKLCCGSPPSARACGMQRLLSVAVPESFGSSAWKLGACLVSQSGASRCNCW